MPRRPRSHLDGQIFHVLNRGNCRMTIFNKPADYAAFIKILEQARQRTAMRILGYCLMPNHWHLALWPTRPAQLSSFMQWVGTTHARRWREHRQTTGQGHLYQGRFKCFPVQDDLHFLTLMRYIHANPLRAGLVPHAQAWEWSSLAHRPGAGEIQLQLSPWPLPTPPDWLSLVNESLPPTDLDRLRLSVQRGRPFGHPAWTQTTAQRLNLQSTLRNPWRPRKSTPSPPQ